MKTFWNKFLTIGLILNAYPLKADLTTDLVAHYALAGGSLDDSGNGHHGVVHGDPITVEGPTLGVSALSFDGIDDYIELPPHSDFWPLEGPMSVAFWMRPAENQADKHLKPFVGVGAASANWMQLNGEADAQNRANIRFGLKTSSDSQTLATYDGQPVNDGDWHHVVGVRRNKTTVEIWLDGQKVDEETNINLGSLKLDSSISIARNPSGGQFFKGAICQLYYFKRALSAEDIEELSQLVSLEPQQSQ